MRAGLTLLLAAALWVGCNDKDGNTLPDGTVSEAGRPARSTDLLPLLRILVSPATSTTASSPVHAKTAYRKPAIYTR